MNSTATTSGGSKRQKSRHVHSGLGTTRLLLGRGLSLGEVSQLKEDERTFLLDPSGGYVGCFTPTVDGEPCHFIAKLDPSTLRESCNPDPRHDFGFVQNGKGPSRERDQAHFKCMRPTCPSHERAGARWLAEWEENREGAKELTFTDEGSQRYYNFLTQTAQRGGGGEGVQSGISGEGQAFVSGSGESRQGSGKLPGVLDILSGAHGWGDITPERM